MALDKGRVEPMPAKKSNKTEKTTKAPSLDDLLAPETPKEADEEAITASSVEEGAITASSINAEDLKPEFVEAEVESFESAELAALKEELAKAREELETARTRPTDSEGRPLSEDALTPEQREIRALQDQLARTKGQSIDAIEEDEEEIVGDGILIHVLADGFTAMGRVFYRGEEIVFGPRAYQDTKDRFGASWLNLDDEAQYSRWGDVRFRKGPWPGKKQYDEPAVATKSIRSVAPITKF